MHITDQTKQTIINMTAMNRGKVRYFLINAEGEEARLNDFGKATAWVFAQKALAVRHASRRKIHVWDSHAAQWVA